MSGSAPGTAPKSAARIRTIALPPSARSRIAWGLTAAAALGRVQLQVCRDCGAVQYPPREACHNCLSLH
ncbi:MAG: zinc ribbon domain-containing protein, partial [Steroidobacteraceae bacterium]